MAFKQQPLMIYLNVCSIFLFFGWSLVVVANPSASRSSLTWDSLDCEGDSDWSWEQFMQPISELLSLSDIPTIPELHHLEEVRDQAVNSTWQQEESVFAKYWPRAHTNVIVKRFQRSTRSAKRFCNEIKHLVLMKDDEFVVDLVGVRIDTFFVNDCPSFTAYLASSIKVSERFFSLETVVPDRNVLLGQALPNIVKSIEKLHNHGFVHLNLRPGKTNTTSPRLNRVVCLLITATWLQRIF